MKKKTVNETPTLLPKMVIFLAVLEGITLIRTLDVAAGLKG